MSSSHQSKKSSHSSSSKSKVECEVQGCNKTFGRKTELKRHMQEQHTPRKTCPVTKCNHRVKRTKLLVGHLEKKHGMRYEEALRQAQAVEASYTDYDYADEDYSQGKQQISERLSPLASHLTNLRPDVSQAASPEPSMTDYQTPYQPPIQPQPSYSQPAYVTDTTATTQPAYHQDPYYQQPPTPWQGQELPYGTSAGFQHSSADSTSGPAPPDPWQYDSKSERELDSDEEMGMEDSPLAKLHDCREIPRRQGL
ncbi:hypothetical protein L207DRAFT_566191 [Hyaloscypha variabilis F]|uniref:C2H2-type domain-containing protein n=1 Tax=Hyaloscypha variabilis (strain UAMH 11265 / GT02V1 / F) TaxID=1149755 RepID=A0A2J6RQM2_HYAVF|nr:hypothetical protein L207DRAFT_566191 [Hyaloscypha variabilis F]